MILNATSLAALMVSVDLRFNQGLARSVTPIGDVAMTVPSTTGQNFYPFLKELGFIREWIGDREIQNLEAGGFYIGNKPFEETHGIPRDAIDDDSYGIYSPMFEQTGQNVASFPSDKVFEALKGGFAAKGPDGQFFFDTDHPVNGGTVSNVMGAGSGEPWFVLDSTKVFKPVIWQPRKAFDLVKLFNPEDPNVFFQKKLIWGVDGRSGVGFSPFWQLAFASKEAPDATKLEAMLTAMNSQRSETGKPLKVVASHLVCGPANYETFRKLMTKDHLANGESNTLKNRLQLVMAPELL